MPYKVSNLNGTLQQEYQADPRLLMALQQQQAGGPGMGPVSSGWEGLAKALTGMVGAYSQKKLGQEYEKKQEEQNQKYSGLVDKLFSAGQPVLNAPTVSGGYGSGMNPDGSMSLRGMGGSGIGFKDTGSASVTGQGPLAGQDQYKDIIAALSPEEGTKAMLGMMPKASEPIKLSKSDRLYAPGKWDKPLVGSEADPVDYNKPFLTGPNGEMVPNPAYQEYAKSTSPRTTINNNMGNSFASGLGGGGADIVKASQAAAQGAVGTIQQGNEILAALDSGDVMSGPGTTNLKMPFKQLMGGDQKKLDATRTVIKGLAEVTLQSRKMLSGQGSVSNNEQLLLERARAGNIDEMSVGEIRKVVEINNRISGLVLQQHNKTLAAAAKAAGPDAGAFIDLYKVDAPAPYAPKGVPAPPPGFVVH